MDANTTMLDCGSFVLHVHLSDNTVAGAFTKERSQTQIDMSMQFSYRFLCFSNDIPGILRDIEYQDRYNP